MKRVATSPNIDHNSYARGTKILFEIWIKYKTRLPVGCFEEQMLQTADFLSDIKLYRLAIQQGYGRYLQKFGSVGMDKIKDVNHFKKTFFPDGYETDSTGLTFRALQGLSLCSFLLEREREERWDQSRVQRLLDILHFLRIMMQAVLPYESLCWLLYNGSLYIYNICRFLMSLNYSAQVMEYLLWASICLETSIPLLNVRFLTWRATLYCAVCQCYYSCQAGVQAEVFARRALGKVNELAKLQEMTGSPPSTQTQAAFKEATIKLAVMMFKRSVYEPRRRPKGLFRPRQKSNLKEVKMTPWPRSLTERALMELFEGGAAQFLALTEALWDGSLSPLQTGAPEEPEIQEVALELMSAGISILAGVGGSGEVSNEHRLPVHISGIAPHSSSLLDLAKAGDNRVSVEAAVKFVKLLFRYEQWDTFCRLSSTLLNLLQDLEDRPWQRAELELTLLMAMEPMINTQKLKHTSRDGSVEGAAERDRVQGTILMSEEMLALVDTLHSCVCGSAQNIQPDRALVMDVVQFLWLRCKAVFQKVQTGHWDSLRCPSRLENYGKWVQVLSMLSEVACACDLGLSDPVAMADMTLRLAAILESTADPGLKSGRKTATSEDISLGSASSIPHCDVPAIFKRSRPERLQALWEQIDRAVQSVSRGRAHRLPCDSTAMSDTVCLQSPKGEDSESRANGKRRPQDTSSSALFIMDLHLELLAIQHRVYLKLLSICPDCVLQDRIGKNRISRAVFLMQKALLSHGEDQNSPPTKDLLEEAARHLEKVTVEEKKLSTGQAIGGEGKSRVPPAPILLSCTHRCMTFSPGPYALDTQVCWYSLYGREATGISPKARLGDCHLLGTGEEVPTTGQCVLRVEGLEPNRKYVFAVAAYDAQGKMVGGAIGESSRPLLASLPLPLLTTWAHLAQASYRTGHHVVAKRACKELWDYITHNPLSNLGPDCNQERLAQTRLQEQNLTHASPLLQKLLLTSIFIETDIHVQEGALYCDAVIEEGPLILGQRARLAECDRMLVAVDLALWLNDSGAALQGIVGCYGLLAPLIYHQIPFEGVIQVLLKCLAVLLEIPGVLRQKRQTATSESLVHMVACITFYLAKVLRIHGEPHMAAAVIDQGKRLLREATMGVATQAGVSKPLPAGQDVAQEEKEKPQKKTGLEEEGEPNVHLKALEASALQNIPAGTAHHHGNNTQGTGVQELTGQEDSVLIYRVISTDPLQTAFKAVMKMKKKACFLDLALLLLQRALWEGQLEKVLEWGQSILNWLCRRDEGLTGFKRISPAETRGLGGVEDEPKRYTSSVIEYNKKAKVNAVGTDRKKKEPSRKKQLGLLKAQYTEREYGALDTLLTLLPPLLRRTQRRRRLRQVCSDERPGRCHLNLNLALSHVTLLRRSVEQGLPPNLQHSYSHMDPALFSLAHCGVLVSWDSSPQCPPRDPQLPPPSPEPTLQPGSHPPLTRENVKNTSREERAESDAGSEVDTPRTQLTNEHDPSVPAQVSDSPKAVSPSQVLESLNKAVLHFRRAMVLAHRGRLWASLQWVCRSLWDQASAVTMLVERGHTALTLEQLNSALTPLLALATDLLIDMMHRLQLWKLFEGEAEWEELEAKADGTALDLCWLRTLALHSLELLAQQGKWEALAHLALLFNHVTRERYTHMVTPLLVHAQRRLQERILDLGGPPVPQPHFTHTEAITGEKVTCRSYTDTQLLMSGVSPKDGGCSKNGVIMDTSDTEAQKALALALVSVPLDVADTLCCFREAVERRPYVLQSLQHSRTLLQLLLAGTQTSEHLQHKDGSDVPSCQSEGPAAIGPPDLSKEDFSSLDSIYRCPLPPSQLHTVISSYSSTIKYLEANKQNSLRGQALHDLGNLHFYNGNKRAAQSCWSKALDCALQSTGVLGSWDGGSWGAGSTQEVLRQAGLWGCLQGAVLTAKIAQFVLTSDLSQRTHCSLLSALLFKSLLTSSLPHPESDWQYSSYELGTELLPGLDLFSQPSQVHIGTTVSSLEFLCHWLYSSGHYLKALPLLTLYLYCVGTVCRDSKRTAAGRILKVQVLTELGLFGDAVRELDRLRQGERIPQPHCTFSTPETRLTAKRFDTSKPLLEPSNLEAIQELVSCSQDSRLCELYGSRVVSRLILARVQLILALCRSIYHFPEPLGPGSVGEPVDPAGDTPKEPSSPTSENEESPSSEPQLQPISNPLARAEDSPIFLLDPKRGPLTPAKLKALMLAEAAHILTSSLHRIQSVGGDVEELEQAVETMLLLSAVSLKQGRSAYSADMAVSALKLLQDAHLQDGSPRMPLFPSSVLSLPPAQSEQVGVLGADPSDVPQAVEAGERVGKALWLRCRLALLRALVAHIPGTAIHPGVDSSTEASRLLAEGLLEAETWGDHDTRALLLLQGALLHSHRGARQEDSASLLQEAVTLLSGIQGLSSRSTLTLASSALQLSDLSSTDSYSLLMQAQELLLEQLRALGETALIEEDGRVLLTTSLGLKNIYLPQLPLLARAAMRLGQWLAQQAACRAGSDGNQWLSAQRTLDSALQIARASATRDQDLETDILYCKGLVERTLVSLGQWKPQAASETFLHTISVTQPYSHTMQLVRSCYMEMARVYLQQWEQSSSRPQDKQSPTPPPTPKGREHKSAGWQRARVLLDRALTESELQLLHGWICVRAASQVSKASANRTQLCDIKGTNGGPLQSTDTLYLPDFTTNDLLTPCGGLEPMRNLSSLSPEPWAADSECSEVTWVQLERYHSHILNLQRMATQPVAGCVEGLCSLARENTLALRLAQLHTLFSSLLPSYRGCCCPPEPPAALLRPHTAEARPSEAAFPWVCAAKAELCLQWHHPSLDASQEDQNTILLIFAFNRAPLTALNPTALALSELRCGQRWVSLERLREVHAELCSVCMGADVSSPAFSSPKNSRHLEKEATFKPRLKMLQEKTMQCCAKIRALLQVNSDPSDIVEVPFEPSLQNLCDLECCFNPGGGALLSEGGVIQWLGSILL
ncbi:hypothetical protein AGOR_G00249440 [Albula goreensis]|uniref:Cilia- and flagella-associated protein 54 n=1 Tax=Albula goreensis TaxID=1534307 RepID=A0A8T3CHS9_9TELE|nr:hypothetical protein AGOR_G00249440 [Albula goreensis]